jgi:2-polyprenyl-3-methyl-5-hydroxy-6-metoxy-1,4-benzoquinol methylase
MRLHLVGIFHTQATSEYSHCAFTGKALRFPRMMQAQGYEVIEYSNEGSEANATEHVTMLTSSEFDELYGQRKDTEFYGDNATVGSTGHQKFEERLIVEMRKRLEPGDIICHPFGHAHQILMDKFPDYKHVETGIGYPTLMPNSFRIFESYAWMHYHQGKENRQGRNYEWVVPNYFDIEEWEPNYEPGQYLAFLGRICSVKGMDTILEIAKYSPWPIVIHGQGDPMPWSHPNIHYGGPISGKARSDFLRNARAALMPTNFTEPFGGSGVEAMLCGTPLIAVDYGAFTETISNGITGFRCHTLQEWLDAIVDVDLLDRRVVAANARSRYSLDACGKQYDQIFRTLDNLQHKGWYELRGIETQAIDYSFLDQEEKPFAQRLVPYLVDTFKPDTVLDLGCGPGTYVNVFNDLGVDCIGYDTDVRVEGMPNIYCKSLHEAEEKADLVLCMEVAEHIDSSQNESIVQVMHDTLNPGGVLIWTAAKPGQGGVGHINCQEKTYWEKLLNATGLVRDTVEEQKTIEYIRNGYHMGWFLQNLMIYRKP